MSAIRVFFAHGKNESASEIVKLQLSFEAQFAPKQFVITSARDEFNQNFSRAGSWDRWIAQVLEATPYGSTKRIRKFDVVAVTSIDVGRATYQIVENALDMRISTVVWVATERRFVKVTSAERSGSASWKEYGRLLTA